MTMTSPDPAAALKEISKEVQDKFNEAGMGKVEEFVDLMEDVQTKAKEGPGGLLKAVQEQVDALLKSIDAAIADPSSVAGGGGCMVSWYGGEVAEKLKGFSGETKDLLEDMKKMASKVQGPMKDLSEAMEKAVTQLEGCLKSLAKLPKLINQEIQGLDSPDDIAKIDTAPMKKALNGGDLDEPLAALGGIKSIVDTAVNAVKSGAEKLEDFLQSAPDTAKRCFDLPAPLCAFQSVLCAQAPELLTELLGMLKKLQSVSLKPILSSLTSTQSTISGLKPSQIKDPVGKFLESAKDLVDRLDKTVAGAKLAGGVGSFKAPW
mmetsp:Transcript_78800/g.189097  ORF Transcript_78800/g.189097 Transcript_78800/m.189097 type:complete len:319 (-) Transcript_78800:63-1019(-)